jgi:hypothetical protein
MNIINKHEAYYYILIYSLFYFFLYQEISNKSGRTKANEIKQRGNSLVYNYAFLLSPIAKSKTIEIKM